MAAGRGAFFQSFMEGLDRKPVKPAPGRRKPSRGKVEPGRGTGEPDSGGRQPGRGTGEPDSGGRQPGRGTGEPGPGGRQPGRGRGEPGPGGKQPGRGRGEPDSGGKQPGRGRGEPDSGGRQPGRGTGEPGPGGRQSGQTGGKRRKKKQMAAAAPSSVGGNGRSCPEPRLKENKAEFPKVKESPPKKNIIERLPSEILLQILSYLDASSLICVSHVSKLFHQLANDDVVWQNVYMLEYGSQMWRPKLSVVGAALEVERVEAGHWKKMYFRMLAGQEINKWIATRHDVSLYTGLPRQTERVLRNLNVSWELSVGGWGRRVTLKQSRAYFFESSMIVRWSEVNIPDCYEIRNIQLFGVRKETPTSPADQRPGLRSVILKLDTKFGSPNQLDTKCLRTRVIGEDVLVKLRHLQPGFIIGTYRGQNSVAFIMVCLHFHMLVEKCLLGYSFYPYDERAATAAVDNSDPEFGLHDYTLHFVLHNTGAEIMSGHFRQLSCHAVKNGILELRVIDRTDLSQHRPLSGNIKLPWKSSTLEGSVENCCIMSLTLLDVFQKPFWCVSSPICARMAKHLVSSDYSGEHYLMNYHDTDGQVKMSLVWFKEQKQFFLISLSVYIPVTSVNRHFSTAY